MSRRRLECLRDFPVMLMQLNRPVQRTFGKVFRQRQFRVLFVPLVQRLSMTEPSRCESLILQCSRGNVKPTSSVNLDKLSGRLQRVTCFEPNRSWGATAQLLHPVNGRAESAGSIDERTSSCGFLVESVSSRFRICGLRFHTSSMYILLLSHGPSMFMPCKQDLNECCQDTTIPLFTNTMR